MPKGDWFPRLFFLSYGVGAFAMAVVDVFFGPFFANQTSFGYAAGWLREIAAFDVLVAYLCFHTLTQPVDAPSAGVLARALALLSLLIASNNVHAFAGSHLPGHLQAAAIHGVACVVGLAISFRPARLQA